MNSWSLIGTKTNVFATDFYICMRVSYDWQKFHLLYFVPIDPILQDLFHRIRHNEHLLLAILRPHLIHKLFAIFQCINFLVGLMVLIPFMNFYLSKILVLKINLNSLTLTFSNIFCRGHFIENCCLQTKYYTK